MPWGNPRTSDRAWRKLRLLILRRDNFICHVCGLQTADEVDHLKPWAEGGTDDPSNLAAICHPCHVKLSSAQGNKARWKVRDARPKEKHPGLID